MCEASKPFSAARRQLLPTGGALAARVDGEVGVEQAGLHVERERRRVDVADEDEDEPLGFLHGVVLDADLADQALSGSVTIAMRRPSRTS